MITAGEAQARLIGLRQDSRRVHVAMGAVLAKMEEIKNGLDYLRVNGFAPERMPSTFMLANEIKEKQRDQISRMNSLLQGIEVMI